MITKNDILIKLKELKPTLNKEFSVKKIGLFGSFSDNSNDKNSDIDLLVELEKPIGWKILSLEIYLEKIFNRKIDLVTKNALKEQIKDTILNQVNYIQLKKENRTYKMYLDDILVSMNRISEYIENYTFIDFKKDYKNS